MITLANGRKEVYIIGGYPEEGKVRLIKSPNLPLISPYNIIVPKELINNNSMVFQPVQKRRWWHEIFYLGHGYLIKKNGRRLLVKTGDLTRVLTKLHNGEMEEIIK